MGSRSSPPKGFCYTAIGVEASLRASLTPMEAVTYLRQFESSDGRQRASSNRLQVAVHALVLSMILRISFSWRAHFVSTWIPQMD